MCIGKPSFPVRVKNTFIHIEIPTEFEEQVYVSDTAPARMCGNVAQSLERACVPNFRKRVDFDFETTSMHEVIPYGEIYGAPPRTFVFDRNSQMIAAGSCGFVSAASEEDGLDNYHEWEKLDFAINDYKFNEDIAYSKFYIEVMIIASRRRANRTVHAARQCAEDLAAELQSEAKTASAKNQRFAAQPRWADALSDDEEADHFDVKNTNWDLNLHEEAPKWAQNRDQYMAQ